MEIAFQEWAELLFRWIHLIVGIAWIGSSFYFIWLDLSLRKSPDTPEEVFGENWSVHGGGFYHSQKYLIAPDHMPKGLHWFKFEAYSTWISGFFLMVVIYYWQSESYLIDPQKLALEPWQAIGLSIFFIISGWVIYNFICKSKLGQKPLVLAVTVFFMLVGISYLLSQVYSDRAALVHVGVVAGSIMVGNVFFIIIPNQKLVVRDLIAGVLPNDKLGLQAKQRSTHNNYLTLPVLLFMLSSHYPMLANQDRISIVVGLVILIGGVVRHFFNNLHRGLRGVNLIWQWPSAITLAILLIVTVSYQSREVGLADRLVSTEMALEIIERRCKSCHSENPASEQFKIAAAGVKFDSLSEVRKHSQQIFAQVVLSNAMPLGNITGMLPEERKILGAWISSEMRKK